MSSSKDGVRNRGQGGDSKKEREYTADQHNAVKRVLRLEATAYYEILSIKAPSHEAEIKKSYRKLALTMHPDKNGAPQADEAFKRISKAFQVLSDPDKKRIFDQTGQDPESRGAGGFGFNQGPGMRRGAGPGAGAGGGLDPNDLFNAFFGGAGGMPGASYSFGGPGGVRFQSFGGGPQMPGDDIFEQLFGFGRRAQPRQRAPRDPRDPREAPQGGWRQYLPLLPFVVLLLLPTVINLFGGSDSTSPSTKFSFEPKGPYTVERKTPSYKIPYYVRNADMDKLNKNKLNRLDRQAETTFISRTRAECSNEWMDRQDLMQKAVGWFSTDEKMLQEAYDMPMPHCDLLDSLGIRKDLT